MASIYGVRLRYKGVQEVMRAPGVREELMRRMERVASRANSSGGSANHTAYMDARPEAHLPAARVGADSYSALVREAQTGYLSASLDAAGGGS